MIPKRRVVAGLCGLLLAATIASCGDEEVPEENAADTTEPRQLILTEPPPRDTGYEPQNEEIFEEIVYRDYANAATQIPRRMQDSAMNAVMASTPDPRKVKDRLQKVLERLGRRQDTLARLALADRYGISLDSVDAIIREVQERMKNR